MPRLIVDLPTQPDTQTRAQIAAWAEHIQNLAKNGGSPEEIIKCGGRLMATASKLLPWPTKPAAAA
mgnify:CR=1 FL=1